MFTRVKKKQTLIQIRLHQAPTHSVYVTTTLELGKIGMGIHIVTNVPVGKGCAYLIGVRLDTEVQILHL